MSAKSTFSLKRVEQLPDWDFSYIVDFEDWQRCSRYECPNAHEEWDEQIFSGGGRWRRKKIRTKELITGGSHLDERDLQSSNSTW